MDIKTTIALYVSIASIIVSLLSLLGTLINVRRNATAAQVLEQLKHALKNAENKKKVFDEGVATAIESLKDSMRAIQAMKDEIQLILAADNASIDQSEAKERLVIAKNKIIKTYQEHHPNLKEHESKLMHKAKNSVIEIEIRLEDKDADSSLVQIRIELDQIQHCLRDKIDDRMWERMKGIKE